MSKKNKLKAKWKLFADEYLIDHNATRSYIAAGYSKIGASQSGARLLRNASISEYIKVAESAMFEKLSSKYDVTAERIMKERARIAFFKTSDLYDNDGNLINPKDWTDDVAAVISSVKVRNIQGEDGSKAVMDVTEIKTHSKDSSLQALEKISGMYEKDNSQKARERDFEKLSDSELDKEIANMKEILNGQASVN